MIRADLKPDDDKDNLKPIYDLVYVARREASTFYALSHVDNEEPVSAAHRAFDALADAVSALTRLVEARAEGDDGEDDDAPLAEDRKDPQPEAALTATAQLDHETVAAAQENEWNSKVFLHWGINVVEHRSVTMAYQDAIARGLKRYTISVGKLPDQERIAWLLKRVRHAKAASEAALRHYGKTRYFHDMGVVDWEEVDNAAESCATADWFIQSEYRDYVRTCEHLGVEPIPLDDISSDDAETEDDVEVR